jgi:hypothetical protein
MENTKTVRFTVPESAAILRVQDRLIQAWIQKGTLRPVARGGQGGSDAGHRLSAAQLFGVATGLGLLRDRWATHAQVKLILSAMSDWSDEDFLDMLEHWEKEGGERNYRRHGYCVECGCEDEPMEEDHIFLRCFDIIGLEISIPDSVMQAVEDYQRRALSAIRFRKSKKYRMTPEVLERIGLGNGSNGAAANGAGNGAHGSNGGNGRAVSREK